MNDKSISLKCSLHFKVTLQKKERFPVPSNAESPSLSLGFSALASLSLCSSPFSGSASFFFASFLALPILSIQLHIQTRHVCYSPLVSGRDGRHRLGKSLQDAWVKAAVPVLFFLAASLPRYSSREICCCLCAAFTVHGGAISLVFSVGRTATCISGQFTVIIGFFNKFWS